MNVSASECTEACGAVDPDGPVGSPKLLVRYNASGSYRLINLTPAGVTPADAHFKEASADLSHVVSAEQAPLTSGAPAGMEDLYEWDEGVPLRLLTMLPDGAPVRGSLAQAANGSSAISADGSSVLFTANGNLYLRLNGSSTVQVDASEVPIGTGANEAKERLENSGGATYMTMSTTGNQVYFTDEKDLTSEADAGPGDPNLYLYNLASPEGQRLTDLTGAKADEYADVSEV